MSTPCFGTKQNFGTSCQRRISTLRQRTTTKPTKQTKKRVNSKCSRRGFIRMFTKFESQQLPNRRRLFDLVLHIALSLVWLSLIFLIFKRASAIIIYPLRFHTFWSLHYLCAMTLDYPSRQVKAFPEAIDWLIALFNKSLLILSLLFRWLASRRESHHESGMEKIRCSIYQEEWCVKYSLLYTITLFNSSMGIRKPYSFQALMVHHKSRT